MWDSLMKLLSNFFKNIKDIDLLPVVITAIIGNGFLILLTFYSLDLSKAIETITFEGVLLTSIVFSSIYTTILILFIAKIDRSKNATTERWVIQAAVFGVGLLLIYIPLRFISPDRFWMLILGAVLCAIVAASLIIPEP